MHDELTPISLILGDWWSATNPICLCKGKYSFLKKKISVGQYWNWRVSLKSPTWVKQKEKIDQTISRGSKVVEIKAQIVEWEETPSFCVHCEVSTICDDLRSLDICWCWTTVYYQVQSRSRSPPQIFFSIVQQNLVTVHTAKSTITCFNHH